MSKSETPKDSKLPRAIAEAAGREAIDAFLFDVAARGQAGALVSAGTSNPPAAREQHRGAVDAFLERLETMPQPVRGRPGRLVFALDATASREPTWDQAMHVQAEMFQAARDVGGLEIQLVFYRGFAECKAGRWTRDTKGLLRQMTAVTCLAGHTQIGKVLRHAVSESQGAPVDAVVFVGDACEEDIDDLGAAAGQLGLRKIPVFMFHEGGDPIVARVFQQIAKLSGGAYCPFDRSSADQLRQLLAAVAAYAAGGRAALLQLAARHGGEALRLSHLLEAPRAGTARNDGGKGGGP